MDKQLWMQKVKKIFSKKSLVGFIDKFGFYLALLVCLVIIGFTALLTQGNSGGQDIRDNNNIPLTPTEGTAEESSGQVAGNGDDDKIDIIVKDIINGDNEPSGPAQTNSPSAGQEQKDNEKQQQDNSTKPEMTGKPQQNDKTVEEESQGNEANSSTNGGDVAVSGNTNNTTNMEVPVKGEVIRPYAMNELIFSQTLKEWTTHTGIDIAGKLGSEVRAALAGTVESIEEDPLKGIVITLDHKDGLKTVYIGLSTKDMVRVGQKIEKGQVISGIGRTAAFEITDDPHLHFEVLLNGEHQDPAKYILSK